VSVWRRLAGASWIPWVVLAAGNALPSPSVRGAVLWGGALGAQLRAGSPDMSAFTGAAVVVFTLARLEWRQPLGAANRSRLAAAILALLFALGLSAAQLLPTLEATGRSMRWNIDPALRGNVGSLHPLVMLAKILSPVRAGPQHLGLPRFRRRVSRPADASLPVEGDGARGLRLGGPGGPRLRAMAEARPRPEPLLAPRREPAPGRGDPVARGGLGSGPTPRRPSRDAPPP